MQRMGAGASSARTRFLLASACPNTKTVLEIVRGSVVSFGADAIVNAANQGCITGGGVDGAITNAGGPKLAEARRALPILKGRTVRCPTGEAVVTVGGALKVAFPLSIASSILESKMSVHTSQAKYCIHAVGPSYTVRLRMAGSQEKKKIIRQCDSLLYSAYRESMMRARELKLETIGFSLISAGIFRGERSLRMILGMSGCALGLSAIGRNVYPELKTVTMFAFNGKEADGLAEAIALADVLVPDENGTTRKLSSKEMDLKKEVALISNAVEASVSPSIKRKQKKDRHDDGNETKQKADECEKNLESNAGDHQVDYKVFLIKDFEFKRHKMTSETKADKW
eukprot:jgi/Bigna1/83971/fgenesh1_pg.119_\